MKLKNIILIIAALMIAGCGGPKSSQKIDDGIPAIFPPEKVANYEKDVVWTSPGGRDILLDVSWPEGDGPFPVLVWIHGGGWEKYSKEANKGLACYMTNRGYVVFNVNYRMAPEVTMKTIIEDAMGAVVWAKDNAAKYNGDMSRIAVAGHSAGGHLAAMVAVAANDPYFTPTYKSEKGNDCSVEANVIVSGVFDFVKRGKEDPGRALRIFGKTLQDDPELYKKCSPISYVKKDLPDTLVIYAGDEGLRPANENWAKLLAKAGSEVESYMQPNRDHLWITWHWQKDARQSFAVMADFLDKKFKNYGCSCGLN